MINKLRGIEKTEKKIPLCSEDGKCIDEDQLPKEIMKYWEGIYRKGESNMMSEWEGEKISRYEEELGHQMEMGGNMVTEYDNMMVYKKILDHLMKDLKMSERRMWRRSDGMFVVQYNRDKDRQQFKYQREEHMDMMSGTIK